MPQKVVVGTFLQENSKKKVYFQLLGRKLYHFKNNHDSYDSCNYDVTKINAKISSSDSNSTDFVINIYLINENESIYRLRPIEENNINECIDWVHNIRRAKQYYKYIDNNKDNSNDDEQKFQSKPQQSQPLNVMLCHNVTQTQYSQIRKINRK